MKVWIVEQGLYEQREVVGIYDSPERAMGAFPTEEWNETTWAGADDVPAKYRYLHGPRYTTWANGKDWDDALRIREAEFTDEGPLGSPSKAVLQVYRDSDGGWDYVPNMEEAVAQ